MTNSLQKDRETKKKLSREEVAAIEVGHTQVSPLVARSLAVAFLLLIVTVPAIQNIHEFRTMARNKAEAGSEYTGRQLPHSLNILNFWPTRSEIPEQSGLDAMFKINSHLLKEIQEYEDALEDNSILQKALIPPAQFILTGQLKGGNEKAYCGKDGWIFFRPGIDYLTARGFLNPAVLESRLQSGNEWTPPPQPDPVKAIVDFKKQLALRGVELVIMPTPVKPMIHPEHFSSRFNGTSSPLQNPSFGAFKKRLEEEGIQVFDIAPDLMELKRRSGDNLYLESDTHWTPQAMQFAAGKLAAFLRTKQELPSSVKYRLEKKSIENIGDIAFMLNLPEGQEFYRRQSVTITQVLTPEGKPWMPDETANVLLLGDSFSNIYSLEGMNWGHTAGFAEHLSASLGSPIDKIVINDNGAFSSRSILSRDLIKGKDRLEGKKVVVWQFAARELLVGDWKLIPMKLGESKTVPKSAPAANILSIKGKVAAMPKPPIPGQVPYKDATIGIHLTDLEVVRGEFDLEQTSEILVYMWVMRDNKLTRVADYKPGQTVTLTLKPWQVVEPKIGGYNRLEIDDPLVLILDAYWGEEK